MVDGYFRFSSTFTYNVASVATGKDRVFKVSMTGEETITVAEIQGALGGEALDTDSLRTEAFNLLEYVLPS